MENPYVRLNLGAFKKRECREIRMTGKYEREALRGKMKNGDKVGDMEKWKL